MSEVKNAVKGEVKSEVKRVVHENPYRAGLYNDIFAFLKRKQVITRAELMDYAMKELGKSETSANAAVTVILSPRKESKIGDCRGNISAQGHLYFMEKLTRQVKAGVKDPQKFRLRWREVALAPLTRKVIEVKQEKTEVAEVVKQEVVKSAVSVE